MSSDNPGENPGHRKPKVSYATLIDVGLVGPKPKRASEGDGQRVKIPVPPIHRYNAKGGRGKVGGSHLLDMVRCFLKAMPG